MNIFAYDDDPVLSALWLDDIRKNKMISESNQMMAAVIDTLQPNNRVLKCGYPKSVLSHGCTLWTGKAEFNFNWLLQHTKAMLSQRTKPHKGWAKYYAAEAWFQGGGYKLFSEQNRTPFYNGTQNKSLGLSFKHIQNTNAAYRLYSRTRWQFDTIKLSWQHGKEPWWR